MLTYLHQIASRIRALLTSARLDRDLHHELGVVPEVRVVAHFLAQQVGQDQNAAARGLVGGEQLLAPVVVAGTI